MVAASVPVPDLARGTAADVAGVGIAPTPAAGAPPGAGASPGGPATPPTRGAAVPWVLSTYFAEGLPYSIAHKVASEFFTAAGASLQVIGLTSFFGIPWNLKFLWSPLVDMVGTPRRWLLLTQLAVGLATAALAWPAARGALGLAAGGFLLLAAIAATHDIAIDGFYLYALDKKSQAAHSGLRVTAYRVALAKGGILVALAGWTSWPVAFLTGGAALGLLAAVHALILPRPRRVSEPHPVAEVFGEGAAPPPPKPRYLEAFATFLRRPRVATIFAFIILYRAGDAMMFAMNSPLLKSLGLDTATRGLLSATLGSIASIAGSILGGLLVARYSLRRTLFPISMLQSSAILLYALLAWLRPPLWGVAAIVVAEQLAAGVGTAALMVFLMRLCTGSYKAAHFAIGSAFMSLAATVAGSASGFIADRVGFVVFFEIAFAASIPGVVLARLVPVEGGD